MRQIRSDHLNGVRTDSAYRDDNLISKMTGVGYGNYLYNYDNNKNKIAEVIVGPLSGYGYGAASNPAPVYDADDRLTEWSRGDGQLDRQWDLSFVGRWNSVTDNNGPATTLTHSEAHEITSFGGAEVSHDAKGNRTGDYLGRSFTWDFDNRMTSATIPAGSSEGVQGTHRYPYDALGRRVSKTVEGGATTVFVCSGSQVLCEYELDADGGIDADNPEQRYIYGNYVDEVLAKDGKTADGNRRMIHYSRNQQYSIVALSDDNGAVVERYAYTPYGQTTVLNGAGQEIDQTTQKNPYTYTGRRTDPEIGLMYFRARYYDAGTGEFISRDPLGYVDGMSLYRGYFVPGGVDPSGLRNYKKGKAKKPKIPWGQDFKYNPDAVPTAKDYASLRAWRRYANAAFLGSALVDGVKAYRHFLSAKGTDLYVNYLRAIRGDQAISEGFDREVTGALTDIEQIHDGSDEARFSVYSSASRSVKAKTENWDKALGTHHIWGAGTVTFDCKSEEYTFEATFEMEDYYNFAKGEIDERTGLPDDANGRFTVLGFAKPFYSRSAFKRTIVWTKGNPFRRTVK